jgi:hypothetical protein
MEKRGRLLHALRTCEFITEEPMNQLIDAGGFDEYPQFDRGTSASIISKILHGEGLVEEEHYPLYDMSGFETDTMFCEYAWHISFDSKMVKVVWGHPQRSYVLYTLDEFLNADMAELEEVCNLDCIQELI